MERFLYQLTYGLIGGWWRSRPGGGRLGGGQVLYRGVLQVRFVGVMLDWVRDGMQEDPKRIVERISLLIEGDIVRALEKMRTDRE